MYEIKHEAEDFIVEEITPEGEVLKVDKEYSFDEESKGDQLICVLQKKNWDTHLALKQLSKRLRVSRKRIGFAGTKDKKAITIQRISLWNIKDNVRDLRIKDMEIIPLKYSNKRVELGDLGGNRFTVKVYTTKKMKKVPKKIPNYFGVQRFGNIRPITHLVGEQIIRGNIEEAVKIYLTKTFPKEKDETQEARKRLAKDRDYKEALKYFPMYLKFERTLIAHLSEYPNDYAGALRKLPKYLKIMFTHAYQSYLFNKFLDEVRKKKLDYKEGPLYGFKLELKNALEKNILRKEKITLGDFRVEPMLEMSSKGKRRPLFLEIKDFKVLKQGKTFVRIRFSLPKGCYATTVIDYLFSSSGY